MIPFQSTLLIVNTGDQYNLQSLYFYSNNKEEVKEGNEDNESEESEKGEEIEKWAIRRFKADDEDRPFSPPPPDPLKSEGIINNNKE